jgi:hypothetical protein
VTVYCGCMKGSTDGMKEEKNRNRKRRGENDAW